MTTYKLYAGTSRSLNDKAPVATVDANRPGQALKRQWPEVTLDRKAQNYGTLPDGTRVQALRETHSRAHYADARTTRSR